MIEQQETRSHGLGVLTAVHEAIARTRGLTAGLFAVLLGALCALGFAPFTNARFASFSNGEIFSFSIYNAPFTLTKPLTKFLMGP